MKSTVLAVLAASVPMLAVKPCPVVAQRATIQASVTVVAPEKQPAVRVVVPAGEGTRRPTVVVSGQKRWGVQIRVGARELALAQGSRGPGRLELSPVEWASVLRRSRASESPIRMILALN